ncbi:mitochondrial assembly of ribosomal large subunit protein 1 [Erpetoichthys calabaricus]|uniref:mitochondrial assembly of ribosomal large subunit protein 1 n=1 Tax=Erpetoichthys calabaricus TaxID=27687 RepID=UPI0022345A6F|nr:mitochondrial assembly of ribosomal large subunit protein 1 [Erpetoichthys calabaricus]
MATVRLVSCFSRSTYFLRARNKRLLQPFSRNFALRQILVQNAFTKTSLRRSYNLEVEDPMFQANRLAASLRESSALTSQINPKFNIDVLVSLLRQENAADICVIKVPEELKYSDYFVVVSGTSTRHIQAMAQYALKVYKYLQEDNIHANIEGKDSEDWLCIDFGQIVVHFMLHETRELYELEKLWTLRSYDDQLTSITPETFPKDFILEEVEDVQS